MTHGVPHKKKTVSVLLAVTSILSLALMLYVFFLPHMDERFDNEEALRFNSGWKYTAADGTVTDVTTPSKLPENIPGGIRVTNTLPVGGDVRYNSIAKYSVFQNYRIYIGGQLVCDTTDPYLSQRHFAKSSGVYWILQRLPADCEGKEIALEITSPYKDYRQLNGTIYLGMKAPILFAIYRECFGNYLVSLLMMILGCIFCLCYMFGKKRLKIPVSGLYIGALQFWLGAWEFSESGMAQLLTGNAVFVDALSFVAMRMSAIALLIYFMSAAGRRWRRWNTALLCVMAAEAAVSAALQLLQVMDFYETVRVCHVILGVTLVTVVVETLTEVLYYRNSALHYLFLSMTAVAAAAVYEIAYFYLKNGTNLGAVLNVGIIVFTVMVTIYEIRKVIRNLALARKAVYFRQLANTDVMTGLANRSGMLEWIEVRKTLPVREKEKVAVVLCDIDRLKRINDAYGHQMGDRAICLTAQALKASFGGHGLCCRTGGDEFTCLLERMQPGDAERLIARFRERVASADQALPFDFAVSVGFAFYSTALDKNMENTIFRADQEMYEMKRREEALRGARE